MSASNPTVDSNPALVPLAAIKGEDSFEPHLSFEHKGRLVETVIVPPGVLKFCVQGERNMKVSPVNVYEVKVESQSSVLFSGFVRVPDDMPLPIDLLACPAIGPQEVYEAIAASKELAAKDDNEPAPTKPAAPKLPTHRTLERQPGDSFECGARTDKPIRVSPRWTAFAFHNPTSRVVGRIRVSLDLSQFTGRSLDLKIFDAFGACLFDGKLTETEIRLDQVRISSGDLLMAFRCPNGATGTGAHNLPHARLLADELPERPQLDSLIFGAGDGHTHWRVCSPTIHPFGAVTVAPLSGVVLVPAPRPKAEWAKLRRSICWPRLLREVTNVATCPALLSRSHIPGNSITENNNPACPPAVPQDSCGRPTKSS